MSRAVAVLRPEPGNAATAARAEALGLAVIRLPLFAVRALAWTPPEGDFDALVLTSANAARHAGAGLRRYAALPVYAVGAATARAAEAAGLRVALTGERDVCALLAMAGARGVACALHLGARESQLCAGGAVAVSVPVYASNPAAIGRSALDRLARSVALLHSPRAAARLADLVEGARLPRASCRLAALSGAIAEAAGPGWGALAIASEVTDASLLAAARSLAD